MWQPKVTEVPSINQNPSGSDKLLQKDVESKQEASNQFQNIPSPETMAMMLSFWQAQQILSQNKDNLQNNNLVNESGSKELNLTSSLETSNYAYYDAHSLKRKPESPLSRNDYKLMKTLATKSSDHQNEEIEKI